MSQSIIPPIKGMNWQPVVMNQTKKVAPKSRPKLAVRRFQDSARQRPTCTSGWRAKTSALQAAPMAGGDAASADGTCPTCPPQGHHCRSEEKKNKPPSPP